MTTTKLEQMCESKYSHYHSNSLELAARHYMSVFGQALEAHGIPFSKDQLIADADLREALAEQAEQEYYDGFKCGAETMRLVLGNPISPEPMYINKDCAERGCACHYSVEVDGEPVAVYAAPVRTKDLTDDEIAKAMNIQWFYQMYESDIKKARAVIAADREKNK